MIYSELLFREYNQGIRRARSGYAEKQRAIAEAEQTRRKPMAEPHGRRAAGIHGTPAEYQRHIRRDEIACDECTQAWRMEGRAYRARRREAKALLKAG